MSAPIVEVEVDLTQLGLGTERTDAPPRGPVSVCPVCTRPGIKLRVPAWRHKPAVDLWVHRALVSPVGYGPLDQCQREVR